MEIGLFCFVAHFMNKMLNVIFCMLRFMFIFPCERVSVWSGFVMCRIRIEGVTLAYLYSISSIVCDMTSCSTDNLIVSSSSSHSKVMGVDFWARQSLAFLMFVNY